MPFSATASSPASAARTARGFVAGGPSVDELREHPEAELVVPGSTVVAQREQEGHIGIDGTNSPTIRTFAGTEESATTVEAFYDRELAERGWQVASDRSAIGLSIRTTSELSARAWRKDDFVFRLAIADKTHPDNGDRADEFETLYRVSLVYRPAQNESQ